MFDWLKHLSESWNSLPEKIKGFCLFGLTAGTAAGARYGRKVYKKRERFNLLGLLFNFFIGFFFGALFYLYVPDSLFVYPEIKGGLIAILSYSIMTTLDQLEDMRFFDIGDKILAMLIRMRGLEPPQEILHEEITEEDNESP